ncbi:transcriptional repressor TCF25-domain-containing protein [Phycomyces blakesleeanus]|uniref:Transcriptional repressor TCF25-domain-containing protein n=1 Tax=Phycomyces blakesleeanus TaxID=4837 RepID=A0ABR3B7W8_PHYBL
MSSRALRRLQKQQLEIEEPEISEEESEDEVVTQAPKKAQNLFALLNGDDEVEEEEEEEEEEEKEVEIKDKKAVAHVSPTTSKKNKKKSKKKNKKVQPKKDISDISMQELDAALKEPYSPHDSSSKISSDYAAIEKCRQLITINTRFLDAEAEMKRMFGSRVVNTEGRGVGAGRILKKSKLCTPKADWRPYAKDGLSMELIETKDGISYFAFKHHDRYQDIQLDFLNAVAMHDPNGLVLLNRRHPYHVDTLLQLSEIAKQSGDWSMAGECIEQALYACERAFHPHFSYGSGNVRLSYTRSENRSFFLAIFRHIQFLTRRGCWRTAFEFNKLLFSLDPTADALGAILSMDYYALNAKDYDYVLRLTSEWKMDGKIYPTSLTSLPNFAFSSAYSKFKLSGEAEGRESECSKMLQKAIQRFPLVASRLLEKLGDSEPSMHSSDLFKENLTNNYLDLLIWTFVERSDSLWKEPEVVIQWLKYNIKAVVQMPAKSRISAYTRVPCVEKGIPLSISRHIVMADVQRLLRYLPSSITSASYHMYDPLPPPDSISSYDINERMSSRGRGTQNNSAPGGWIAAMQDLLRGQGLGGGGRQITPETADMVRRLMEDMNAAQDRLPGTFPEDDDADFEEANHEIHDVYDSHPPQLGNTPLTTEELGQILNAVEDDDMDLQIALAQTYEQNRRH